MKLAPIPYDEPKRILAVQSLGILDSEPEERFDRITRVVQLIFNIPFVFITLVDKDRVWFKSRQGCDLKQEPRDTSFCGHTICNMAKLNTDSRIFEVSDASLDPRFHDNPEVVNEPLARFYIGFALQSSDKKNVGTLCMVDTRPRHLASAEKIIFCELGLIAESELNKNEIFLNNDVEINNLLRSLSPLKELSGTAEYFYRISDATDKMVKDFDKFLKRRGISYKEWRVLNEICQSEYSTQIKIVENTNYSKPTVSHLVQVLTAKQLIKKRFNENDKRRNERLCCTEAGKKMWLYGVARANKCGSEIMNTDVSLDTERKQKNTH